MGYNRQKICHMHSVMVVKGLAGFVAANCPFLIQSMSVLKKKRKNMASLYL